jgi:hypothetical protein
MVRRLRERYRTAAETVDSGAAKARLAAWVDASQSV